MDSTQTQFDQAYVAALPPELQALMAMPADSADAIQTRVERGAALAGKGYTIDAPVMVYSWDAFLAMTERQNMGLTWVPSALQPGLGSPGGIAEPGLGPQPGQTAYARTIRRPDRSRYRPTWRIILPSILPRRRPPLQ